MGWETWSLGRTQHPALAELLPLQEVGEEPRTGTSTSLDNDLSCRPGKLVGETPGVQHKAGDKKEGL